MQRDMDLCREILRRVEDFERANEAFKLEIAGRTEDELDYHVKLLGQAGLLEVYAAPNGRHTLPIALTGSGCEFMDATRDEHKWKDVKAKAVKATGSVAFEVVKAVISTTIEAAVKG
jgi:hypothetical protein